MEKKNHIHIDQLGVTTAAASHHIHLIEKEKRTLPLHSLNSLGKFVILNLHCTCNFIMSFHFIFHAIWRLTFFPYSFLYSVFFFFFVPCSEVLFSFLSYKSLLLSFAIIFKGMPFTFPSWTCIFLLHSASVCANWVWAQQSESTELENQLKCHLF